MTEIRSTHVFLAGICSTVVHSIGVARPALSGQHRSGSADRPAPIGQRGRKAARMAVSMEERLRACGLLARRPHEVVLASMSDHTARLTHAMRRLRQAADLQPLPSNVRVLVAPPLGRRRVWAGFHLPSSWLRAAGWGCDYLVCQRRAHSWRDYERLIGARSRLAWERLAARGTQAIAGARRRDVEEALAAPDIQAIILVGHHTGGGVELTDGVLPRRVLNALLDARGARGMFGFVWMACPATGRGPDVSAAPDALPLSAPVLMELSGALESIGWWLDELDGHTPFDVAQQRALVRQWPSDPLDPSDALSL